MASCVASALMACMTRPLAYFDVLGTRAAGWLPHQLIHSGSACAQV